MLQDQNEKKQESTGASVGRLVEQYARRFAAFLTRQSERFTRQEKKIILLVFGILAGAASALLVIPSTSTKIIDRPGRRVVPGQVQAPGVEPPPDKLVPGKWPGYPAALRALDSLYALDPRRFLEMVTRHLPRRDSIRISR
jgi:hypothetical protein